MRPVSIVSVVVALLAGGVLTAPPASAATPTWTSVASASPPGPPLGSLAAVACATPSRCFAVGQSFGKTLIQQWDGAHWTIVTDAAAVTTGNFVDVACSSATNCFAVGFGAAQASVAAQWNGSAWATPSFPSGSGALESVACSSATNCFTVGENGTHASVEQWLGSTWAVVATPDQPGAVFTNFTGVGCVSTTDCTVVGSYTIATGPTRPLTEHWNGTAWSITASPFPAEPSERTLNAVSCASSTACFAVGSQGSSSSTVVIEQWNGAAWSDAISPSVAGGLGDVSCSTSTSCVAVGSVDVANNGPGHNLVEQWNGTSWSVIANPNTDALSAGFGGVACNSATDCFAVAGSGKATAPAAIEHWNGSAWSITTPTLPTPSAASLGSVSCGSPSPCFAVGQNTTSSGVHQTLVERPVGGSWRIVPSPNPAGARQSGLSAVVCRTTSFCIAVGAWSKTATSKTLIERWNGTKWTIVPSPNHGADPSGLSGVSCPTTTVCFAVGSYSHGGNDQTLIERWNGSKWTIVASPNRPRGNSRARDDVLAAVSCSGPAMCFAVGRDTNVLSVSTFQGLTLTERWNGTKWSIVASPSPGANGNGLSSVSCPVAGTCYAVGYAGSPQGAKIVQHSLVVRWNGHAWSKVAAPDRATATVSVLSGISCSTATACTAVGADSGGGLDRMIARSRVGAAWKTVALPDPHGNVTSISCSSATRCYAVGGSPSLGFGTPLRSTTLVKRFS